MFGFNKKEVANSTTNEKRAFVKIDDRYYFYDKIPELSINELDEDIARANAGIQNCQEQITRIMEVYGPIVTDFKQKDKMVRITHAMNKMKRGMIEFTIERKRKMRDLRFDEQSFFRTAAKELLDEATYSKITLRAKAIFEMKKGETVEQESN